VAERLAGVDVRHVDLDDRHFQDRERVADCDAVVRHAPALMTTPSTFSAKARWMRSTISRSPLVWKHSTLGAELLAERYRLGIDLGERDRSVLGGSRFPNMLRLMPLSSRIFIDEPFI
jgi:hypothetical protein